MLNADYEERAVLRNDLLTFVEKQKKIWRERKVVKSFLFPNSRLCQFLVETESEIDDNRRFFHFRLMAFDGVKER